MRRCTVEGCDRKHHALGFCKRHHYRAGILAAPPAPTRPCVICGNPISPTGRPGTRPLTCSDACRKIRDRHTQRERRAAIRKGEIVPEVRALPPGGRRVCIVCGQPIPAASTNQVLCSPECTKVRKREQRTARRHGQPLPTAHAQTHPLESDYEPPTDWHAVFNRMPPELAHKCANELRKYRTIQARRQATN